MQHSRIFVGFSLAGALVTVVLGASLLTALAPVLDVRPGLLATSTLSGLGLILSAKGRRRGLRTMLRAAAALALVAALATAYDLTVPYGTVDVSFESDGATLSGTLYLPRGVDRHAALVLVGGSGRQTRDEYRFYARTYARRGIAALAYDKRGSGRSTGVVTSANFEQLAGDAEHAVNLLRGRAEVDPLRVGVWGLSEGEWVGTLAARQANAAFLVLVSPSAMTPAEQVGFETGANVTRAGYPAAAPEARRLYAQLSDFQRTGVGRDALNARLATASREPWFEAAAYLDARVPEYDSVLALPWFAGWRARMDFDSATIFATLQCPVLAQIGGADPKNDGTAALERIRGALARGGNTHFTGVVYPAAEHGIIEWRPLGHALPPWFARGYLEAQLRWVLLQTAMPPG